MDLMRTNGTDKKKLIDLISQSPICVSEFASLNEARNLMVKEGIGRLLVTDPETGRLTGILTRSDLLRAHLPTLAAESKTETKFPIRRAHNEKGRK